MNMMNFDPWMNMEQQRRHEEVLKNAAQIRLAVEASQSEIQRNRNNSKIIVLIRKELATVGLKLQERYGTQTESNATLSQQSNPSGCD